MKTTQFTLFTTLHGILSCVANCAASIVKWSYRSNGALDKGEGCFFLVNIGDTSNILLSICCDLKLYYIAWVSWCFAVKFTDFSVTTF